MVFNSTLFQTQWSIAKYKDTYTYKSWLYGKNMLYQDDNSDQDFSLLFQ